MTISVQDSLNAIMQDLQAPNVKDKKKTVDNLNTFLRELGETGQCPADVLGHHVCCNVIVLLIEHFVSPALLRSKNLATVRSDVTRPFRQVIDALHKHIPQAWPLQPLLFKKARPLLILMKHIVEVLQGEVTCKQCAQDYTSLVSFLLSIPSYRENISKKAIAELTRLCLRQLTDIGADTSCDAMSEHMASALADLVSTPQFQSAVGDDHSTLMPLLVEVTLRRHQQIHVSSSLKVEMHLVRGLTNFTASIGPTDPNTALLAFRVLKTLLDAWHATSRRDGWRMEVLTFATAQLSLHFGDLIHESRRGDASLKQDPRHRATSLAAAAVRLPGSAVIRALHESVLPSVLSILSAGRCEIAMITARELAHVPCDQIQCLFDCCALVIFLARATHTSYAGLSSTTEHSAAAAAGAGLEALRGTKRGRDAEEQIDRNDSPWTKLRKILQSTVIGPATTSMGEHDAARRKDSWSVWLHTLAVPMIAWGLHRDECSELTAMLLQLVVTGNVLEQPLMAALSNFAPRAHPSLQAKVFSWAVTKYVGPTGIELDDGTPSALAYALLARLCEEEAVDLCAAMSSSPSSAGAFERATLQFPGTLAKSAHFIPSVATRVGNYTVARFMLRWSELLHLRALDRASGRQTHHHPPQQDLDAPDVPLGEFDVTQLLHYLLCTSVSSTVPFRLSSAPPGNYGGGGGELTIDELVESMSHLCFLQSIHSLRRQGSCSSALEQEEATLLAAQQSRWRASQQWKKALPASIAAAVRLFSLLDPSSSAIDSTHPSFTSFAKDGVAPMTIATFRCSSLVPLSLLTTLSEQVTELVASVETQFYRFQQQQHGAASDDRSALSSSSQELEQQAELPTKGVRLAHVVLLMGRNQLWAPPTDDVDGLLCAQETVTAERANQPDPMMTTSNPSLPPAAAAAAASSSAVAMDPMTVHRDKIASKLSPAGRLCFAVQRLCELVALRLARTDQFLSERSCLGAMSQLLDSVSPLLCSTELCFWEPRQRILGSMGLIGRRLFEFGIIRGITSVSTSSTVSAVKALTFDSQEQHLETLQFVIRIVQTLYVTLRQTRVFVSSTDPLLESKHMTQQLILVAKQNLFLMDVDPEQAMPKMPQLAMAAIGPLLSLLLAMESDDAHRAVVECLRTLFGRHCHSHLNDFFELVSEFGLENGNPRMISDLILNNAATLCEESIAALQASDAANTMTAALLPQLTPSRLTAMGKATALLLHRCSSALGQRLGAVLFRLLRPHIPFEVRAACAAWIAVPFHIFSSPHGVLHELLVQTRHAIMHDRGSCVTALLSLCNACVAAPVIEEVVVSSLLEYYATRNFQEYKGYVLEALVKIAVESGVASGSTGNPPAAHSFLQRDKTGEEPPVPLHATLTRRHKARLVHDWVWRFRHPLESLPTVTFGYDTLFDLITDFVDVLLPPALLLLHRNNDRSALQKITEVIPMVNGDVSPLLRQYFPSTMTTLLLFQEISTALPTNHHAALPPQTRTTIAHAESGGGEDGQSSSGSVVREVMELQAAAANAIHWVSLQMGNELFLDFCRRHADGIISMVLQQTSGMTVDSTTSRAGGGGARSSAQEDLLPQLPLVPFSVVCRAVSKLCLMVDTAATSLGSFFAAAHGDRGYVVMWHTYEWFTGATSTALKLRALCVLQAIMDGWFSDLLVHSPHLLEASLAIASALLNDPIIVDKVARRVICVLVKMVWKRASEAHQKQFTKSSSRPATASSRPQQQQQLTFLSPYFASLSSALMTLAAQYASEIGVLWVELRKDGVVSTDHGVIDWQEHQYQLRSMSQQELMGDNNVEDVTETREIALRERNKRVQENMRTILHDLPRMITSPSAGFLRDIAAVVDRDSALLRQLLLDEAQHLDVTSSRLVGTGLHDSKRTLSSSAVMDSCVWRAAQHLLSLAMSLDGLLDTRVAAFDAFRGLALVLMDVCGNDARLLSHLSRIPKGSSGISSSSSTLDNDLLTLPTEEVFVRAYTRILQQLRRQCFDGTHGSVVVAASVCLRAVLHSNHELIARCLAHLNDPNAAHAAEMQSCSFSAFQRQSPPLAASRSNTSTLAPGGKSAPVAPLASPALWADAVQRPDDFPSRFIAAVVEQFQAFFNKMDFVAPLVAFAQRSPAFAQSLLPVIVLHHLMIKETDTMREVRRSWSNLLYQRVLLSVTPRTKPLARVLLRAIHTAKCALVGVLREHGLKSPIRKRPVIKSAVQVGQFPQIEKVSDVWWLSDLSAVELAEACQACDEWQLSLSFLELSCEDFGVTSGSTTGAASLGSANLGLPRGLVSMNPVSTSQALFPRIAAKASKATKEASKSAEQKAIVATHRALLMQPTTRAAEALDDEDLMSACIVSALPLHLQLVQSAMLKEWGRVLSQQDYSLEGKMNPEQAVQALLQMGNISTATQLGMAILHSRQGSLHHSSALRQATAEAAWRTQQWDFPASADVGSLTGAVDDSNGLGAWSFHESIFSSLRAVQQRDLMALRVAVRQGQRGVVLKAAPWTLSQSVVRFQALKDVDLFGSELAQSRPHKVAPVWLDSSDRLFGSIGSGGGGGKSSCIPYPQLEMLDSVRYTLIHLDGNVHWLAKYAESSCRRMLEHEQFLNAAERRLHQFLQVATTSTAETAGGQAGAALTKLPSIQLLQGEVLYRRGNAAAAVLLLQQAPEAHANGDIVRTVARWSHESQLLPTSVIVRDTDFQSMVRADASGEGHYYMATLCELLMQDILTRWESAECDAIRRSVTRSQALVLELKQQAKASTTREATKMIESRMHQVDRDINRANEDLKQLTSNWELYRCSAVHSYARYLQHGSPHGTHDAKVIFRVVDLWLSNVALLEVGQTAPASKPNDSSIVDSLQRIPTHKFLPLYTQLAARLGTYTTDQVLHDTLVRVAQDHPYHTVWQLLALAHGDSFTPQERLVHTADFAKVHAATAVLDDLRRTPALAKVVTQMMNLSEALLELAFTPSEKASTVKIDAAMKLLNPSAFGKVPLPTVTVPIDYTAGRDYAVHPGVPTVCEFRAHYDTVGGINLPKLLFCSTSVGTWERMLLKSKDDLRQDAIIEQVFGLCNGLLELKEDARQRRLQIRTYSVVPLSPTSGILRWVPDTMPIGTYLIGPYEEPERGAHPRYHPQEMSSYQCRERLAAAGKAKDGKVVDALKSIYSEFTPVMHHFFYEMFASPDEWYERRRDYARSVAVSSIVGYLVGLGDRHASNILLDVKSAEVVHIDLGIAFEQSKLLPIPERVPFRLTRDLVDGMGIHGVEGPFRRACEVTLCTVRQQKELLATILDAFLHDPLAKWEVQLKETSAVATAEVEPGALPVPKRTTAKQRPADADRAVARAKEKLRGYEQGEVFGVEGQVQHLIAAATSVENLAPMFVGWSCWL